MMAHVARFELRQRFAYDYPGPIHHLRHRLMISPLDGQPHQRRLAQRLHVSPEVRVSHEADAFGNAVVWLEAERLERRLVIELESTVERRSGFALRRVPRGLLDEPAFRAHTALTRPDAALLAAAKALRAAAASDEELAAGINAFVFENMRYVKNVTNVTTTAAEAFGQRSGVCQDYAHVVLALARACGLAARYVSGHVLGEGGTHAWVEIILASEDGSEAVAWPFDPTQNRPESLDYVVVAVGSDYADVAPTSGTYVAPYSGALTTEKSLVRLDVA